MKKQEQSKNTNKTRNQQTKQKQIYGFQGYYSFLSNQHPTWVFFQGILYPSVSTASQAARTPDQKIRKELSTIQDVDRFAEICMNIKNPIDWKEKKAKVMEVLIRDKFKRNKQLANKLMSTKDRKLINVFKKEGFNQLYWGVVNGKGTNMLGKIIMDIRREITNGNDTKNWIQKGLNLETNEKMWPIASLLVLKDTKKIDKLFLQKKNYFLLGSLKTSDFFLENPTISRYHACIYYSTDIQAMLVDLNSTHGTFLIPNGDQKKKIRLQSLIPYSLSKNDKIQFGTSAREYLVDQLDRQSVEKQINEIEQNLQRQLKEAIQTNKKLQKFQELNQQQVKRVLTKKCIAVEGLDQSMSYQKIKQKFQKYGKVKKIQTQIDHKSGKFRGTAVIHYEESQAIELALKQQKKYKIRSISQDQISKILRNNNPNGHRKRSPSEQRNKQKKSRSRSREKKQRR